MKEIENIYGIELAAMYAIADMEDRGCRVDLEYLRQLKDTLEGVVQNQLDAARKIAPTVNIASATQIIQYFSVTDTPLGKTSDEGALLAIKDKSPLAQIILDYRKYKRLKTTYVESLLKLQVNEIVHPNFRTIEAQTGRLSCTEPNLQNIPKEEGEFSIRKAFIPRAGHNLFAMDYNQQEVRIFVHYAKDKKLTKLFSQEDPDFHTDTAALIFGVKREEVTKKQRTYAKSCIAEGELVLTNKGLIPIENVTKSMLLWDGEEWVSHDGLIYKGYKEVIYYDGLWATPDHEVVLEDGSTCRHEWAQQRGIRLARGVHGKEEIWDRYHHRENGEDLSKRGITGVLSSNSRGVQQLQTSTQIPCGQHYNRKDNHMCVSKEFKVRKRSKSLINRGQIRCNTPKVPHTRIPKLSSIWWKRNTVQVQNERRFYSMGITEPTTCNIQKCTHRSYRQRWALRTWKFTPSVFKKEQHKQKNECICGIQGNEGSSTTFVGCDEIRPPRTAFWEKLDSEIGVKGVETRGNTESKTKKARWSKVYDIGNAGPRHRFTVSGKLVLNCTFGLLYGMGKDKLANSLGIPVEEAIEIKEKYFEKFPTAKKLVKATTDAAFDRGWIRTFFGRKRFLHYMQGKIPINDSHKALNTIIQGTAADIMKLMLVKINGFLKHKEGVPYEYPYGVRILLSIHDEIIIEVPEGQEGLVPFIKDTLEYLPMFEVPMVVDVSLCNPSWAEKTKITKEQLEEWRTKPVSYDYRDELDPYKVIPIRVHTEDEVFSAVDNHRESEPVSFTGTLF